MTFNLLVVPTLDEFVVDNSGIVQVQYIVKLSPGRLFEAVIAKAGLAGKQMNTDPFAVCTVWETFRHYVDLPQ
jgi:hypothetical protein